jgi:enamine deaminase RidA (YjgF/YER057c/UK114 family)
MPNRPYDARFDEQLGRLGIRFEAQIRAGANYDVAVEHDGTIYVSGQIPRIDGGVAVTGRVGAEATLAEGRRAAAICALRALAVVRQTLGSLNRVERILRATVYVQSAAGFTQQSEVADAASEILYAVFAPAGGHTRTSIGAYHLPKNAAVELDLIAAVQHARP